MKDGMLFIWVEKEYIMQIVRHLESMNFWYVENVCYVMLDQLMEKGKFLKVNFLIYFKLFRGQELSNY
jgi:hypothetical protein